jgi:hypothetical protein
MFDVIAAQIEVPIALSLDTKTTGSAPPFQASVGIDLAKNVFQVHGIDERGKTVLGKQLRRVQPFT